MSLHIEHLPKELLHYIIDYLEIEEILILTRLNKFWYIFIKEINTKIYRLINRYELQTKPINEIKGKYIYFVGHKIRYKNLNKLIKNNNIKNILETNVNNILYKNNKIQFICREPEPNVIEKDNYFIGLFRNINIEQLIFSISTNIYNHKLTRNDLKKCIKNNYLKLCFNKRKFKYLLRLYNININTNTGKKYLLLTYAHQVLYMQQDINVFLQIQNIKEEDIINNLLPILNIRSKKILNDINRYTKQKRFGKHINKLHYRIFKV